MCFGAWEWIRTLATNQKHGVARSWDPVEKKWKPVLFDMQNHTARRHECDTNGDLELELPIQNVGLGSTIHQLAAKKAMQELEEGHGWITETRDKKGKPLKSTNEPNLSSPFPIGFPLHGLGPNQSTRLSFTYGVLAIIC